MCPRACVPQPGASPRVLWLVQLNESKRRGGLRLGWSCSRTTAWSVSGPSFVYSSVGHLLERTSGRTRSTETGVGP